jgi:hypothetical protein
MIMADKKISLSKGLMTALNVVLSFAVSSIAIYIAKKTGVQITADQQTQIIVGMTSLTSGAVAGIINFAKHKGK